MKHEAQIATYNVFETNAAKLRDLHGAINTTFRRRNDGDAQWQAWKEACRLFHASYDALAFPGGLGKAMLLFEKRYPETIEMVVRFLEADPWFFRSGYHKAYMIKQLRQFPLSEDHRKRLQQVILARIESKETPREFRSYCRLARYVSDADFERQVASLARAPGQVRQRHAGWVLAQLT
jgi:hypothetical protein